MADNLMLGSDYSIQITKDGNEVVGTDKIISFEATPQIKTLEAQHLGFSTIQTGEDFGGYKGSVTLHIEDAVKVAKFQDDLVKRARRQVAWFAINIEVTQFDKSPNNQQVGYAAPNTAAKVTYLDVSIDSPSVKAGSKDGFVEFSFNFTCSDILRA
jgi:hypothetical protein